MDPQYAQKAREAAEAVPAGPFAGEFQTALSLHENGHLQEAARRYQKILNDDPRHFEAFLNLGLARLSLGELEGALEAARSALALRPDSPDAQGFVGYLLGRLEYFEEAVEHIKASLMMRPANWIALTHLSSILFWLNRSEEMIVWLERALAADPNLAAAHQMLGSLYHGLGRHEDARRELERAVALAPASGVYHRALGEVKTYRPDDPQLAQMNCLLREALPQAEQAGLQFALAKAYADLGDHKRSFAHLIDGNRIVRRQIVYHEAQVLGVFQHAKDVFTPAFVQARSGQGDPSDMPVFIVGMPRSGSTLVEQILASHPAICGAGENRGFPRACKPHVQQFPDDVLKVGAGQLREIGANNLGLIEREARGVSRVTDKLLANFLLVGLIHLVFPNARIIHTLRDPLDTCLSCFATHFAESQPFAYELGELGRYYRGYRSLMDHWRAVLPENVMLDIWYENVVGDLEGEARRMIAHCGLAWDPVCLAFEKSPRAVWTASASQVRRPLYRTSIGRAKPEKSMLQPLLDALGPYAPA